MTTQLLVLKMAYIRRHSTWLQASMAFMSWLEHASWLYAGLERGPDTSLQSITLDLRLPHGIGILLTLFGSFCLSASIGGVADQNNC